MLNRFSEVAGLPKRSIKCDMITYVYTCNVQFVFTVSSIVIANIFYYYLDIQY